MDTETKNYVDARTEATRAQNDVQFAKVMAKLDQIPTRGDQVKWIVTWTLSVIAILVAVLMFGGALFRIGAEATALIFERSNETQQTGEDNAEDIAAIKDTLDDNTSTLEEIAEIVRRESGNPNEPPTAP